MSSSSEEKRNSDSDSDSSEEEIKRRKRSKSKKSKHSKESRSRGHKKDKKSKKKHKRRRTPSSSEESSSEEEWVSKEELKHASTKSKDEIKDQDVLSSTKSSTTTSKSPPQNQPPTDDWMNFDSMLATYSNDSKKAKRQKEKEAERERGSIDQLGQSERELNPYWKNGGKGLPSEDPSSSQTVLKASAPSAAVVGDGGLNWLRKAFLRAKEQAKEEGRSLEEIAEERWGSLQSFLEMLEAAEEKAKQTNPSRSRREDEYRSRRGDEYSRNSSNRRRSPVRFQRPRENSDSDDNTESRHSRSHKSSSSSSRSSRNPRTDDYYSSRSSSHRSTGSGWRKPRDPESATHRQRSSPSPERKGRNVDKEESSDYSKVSKEEDKLNRATPEVALKSSDASIRLEPMKEEKEEVKVLTDKEMNELSAKILKAELLGNQSLVDSLKAKKVEAEKVREEFIKSGSKRPEPTKKVIKIVLEQEQQGAGPRRKVKEKPGDTHKDGERVRYFPDDDRQTLKNMFEQEKRNTVENENALFSRLAGKGIKANEDYDMDDIFVDKASSSKREMKDKERELREIIDEDKSYKKTLEGCNWCFDGNKLQKNLVVAIGEKSFLCLPPYQSLTDGHCLIVPMFHTSCSTELDEDVWDEMQKFRKAIVNMFAENDEDVVIFETAVFLKKHPHMYLECVPMPKETGELAPIYFKKAIQECETEWSQNKKLVDLRNRNVRKAVPKGLPYFSVDFGMDSGFAHVIEDERYFPRNFAQEIVGGMLELDHSLWRKQKQDDFITQRNKVMEFLKGWGPHDWTK